MKHTFLIFLFTCFVIALNAQHSFTVLVQNKEDKTALAGATAAIASISKTVVADSAGKAFFNNVPAGNYTITVSYVGLQTQQVSVSIPATEVIYVSLEEDEEHEEEVIVTATRTSRSISDIATRVEIISGEELTEKGNMKPGDIRMLLNESTGIQTQQTSATSYNSSIRIQGLDGRYTQLLRDGLPLYAGFSGGLSLMQVAPLDLRQVEVIKGSSSTLYGGGAIAGLVNLVSKVPTDEREISFLANATSAKGLDLSGFYSEKFNKVGVTVFGSRNAGSSYDPAGIGFTAIPKFERYTLNTKVFLYGEKTNANAGVSFITEDRLGGSIDYIRNNLPGYFEQNNSGRITTTIDVEHALADEIMLHFKSSYSNFKRTINIPQYSFEGRQQSSYSELNLQLKRSNSLWIAGLNFITDGFDETRESSVLLRNYNNVTWGAFVQNTWSPSATFTLETGLRGDYVEQYGFEWLPRFSAMYKIHPKLTARLGGGLGYKTPTVFNEESESLQFQNILPINEFAAQNERSIGGNLDFNYRTSIGEVRVAINHLFFYTKVNRPLILTDRGAHSEFVNANGYVDTKGMETNLRLAYNDFKLFVGYTYADVNLTVDQQTSRFPLTTPHRLNNVLMYEKEDNIKIGLEAYYVGPQKLNDGTTGKSYWTTGLMLEKIWEKFSVFINFENFTDTRQTRFDTIYTGPISNPRFKDIYAPVDGFVTNGGIKVRL